MIVISDTSPITYLIQIGELWLLKKLFDEIVIPSAVYNELEAFFLNTSELSLALTQGWMRVQSPLQGLPDNLEEDLDDGEAAALALALELHADLVLIDERRAATVAQKLRLRSFGLTGVLIEAKQQAEIAAVKPLLDKIIACGFRVSTNFYQTILSQVNE